MRSAYLAISRRAPTLADSVTHDSRALRGFIRGKRACGPSERKWSLPPVDIDNRRRVTCALPAFEMGILSFVQENYLLTLTRSSARVDIELIPSLCMTTHHRPNRDSDR
ncbi:hypothetical protein EVAR_24709_1 [Eumeta japonica]|uniref:Uncharacterized protein n=1 Tax=Eumeta variegata TaxID=151549 RepID=A0A4C1VEP3_EUMVA|nr:hypothetical protein EVAR_24709_1 [Eumeta japonica]